MKILLLSLLAMFSVSPARASAQEVSAIVLQEIIRTYAASGYRLEVSILPDFTRRLPTPVMTDLFCYPGKTIHVVSLTAKKPVEWKYKVSQGDFAFGYPNAGGESEFSGHRYFMDILVAQFATTVPNEPHCLRLYAYDVENIALPVYTNVFSR